MIDAALLAEVSGVVRRAARLPASAAVGPESRLIEDLAIDSLDLVGVVLAVQDHFDVVIEDDLVPSLRRVVDLAEVVARQRGLAAA
jgi:acyl carrier protein